MCLGDGIAHRIVGLNATDPLFQPLEFSKADVCFLATPRATINRTREAVLLLIGKKTFLPHDCASFPPSPFIACNFYLYIPVPSFPDASYITAIRHFCRKAAHCKRIY